MDKRLIKNQLLYSLLILSMLWVLLTNTSSTNAQAGDNPNPPAAPVKIIFIHHSTGENWLRDDYGNLGKTLGANNYFVSDTNYGWGPDAIGDRTDIPNWLEWWGPEHNQAALSALYNESAQHSEYTRTLPDPGGENQIIMFKSCFPNSELSGTPNDPPTPGSDLTVGNAKYIYNEALKYFTSRPDKLFIVITAPPLRDAGHAKNARAFNNWLMYEWLKNYPQKNIAVFDFYNVLTGPKNHHWFHNGTIEHINNQGGDTSYYPSEDDHPSAAGSQKATNEYLPLLNIFYNRWKNSAPPSQPPAQTTISPQDAPTPLPTEFSTQPSALPAAPTSGIIDDFETNVGAWNNESNDNLGSKVVCQPDKQAHSAASSLKIEYTIRAGGWGDCGHSYETPQNWSAGSGISLWIHSEKEGEIITFTVSSGRTPFTTQLQTKAESKSGWADYNINWDNFQRADWAESGGLQKLDPLQMDGINISVGAGEVENKGKIWIDDISLIGINVQTQPSVSQTSETKAPPPAEAALPKDIAQTKLPVMVTARPNAPSQESLPATPAEKKSFTTRICPVSASLPFGIISLIWIAHRRKRNSV